MDSQFGVFCQLCSCTILGNNFEEVGESTKEISEMIFLNKNLLLIKGQIVCLPCSKKLQNAFDFKYLCISIEDFIVSTRLMETPQIDMRDVYIKKHKNEEISISENQKVCRLCLQLIYKSYTSLLDTLEQDMVKKLIPDIAIQNTIDPFACETCTKALYAHFTFINDCVYIHEKKLRAAYIDKKLSTENFKREDVNLVVNEETLKLELNYNYSSSNSSNSESTDTVKEIVPPNPPIHIKKEQFEEKCNVLYDLDSHTMKYEEPNTKSTEKHIDVHHKHRKKTKKRSLKCKIHKCQECDYYTTYGNALKSHQLNHKKPSEITMFACEACRYKTKYRNALKSHQLNHMPASEVPMRKCLKCSYKTKHRTALVLHMLKHQNPKEIKMFKCDVCKFQTKFKHALKPHMAKHTV